MEIQIRKLLPEESNAYREIRLQCLKKFPNNFTSNYPDEKTKPKLFFQPYIEQSNSDNFVIGAFYKNQLVGISGFRRYERRKTDHRGIIIQVYVNPDHQGKNIGFNIIKATLVEAFKIEGIEQIEIDVLVSNEKAANIYAKIGFETYGIQKNYLKMDHTYFDHKMMQIFKSQYLIS